MAKKPLKKAIFPKSQSTENQENAALTKILGDTVLPQITGGSDNFPNIDGYIHLLEENRAVSGQSLQIQIKPLLTNQTGPYATCRPTLLAHAQDSTAPVLLIGVNPKDDTAYWIYLSPEYVNDYVDGKESVPEETVTVYFPKKNKIKVGDTEFAKDWKKVCNYHRNKFNDKIISRYVRTLGKGAVRQRINPERLETLQHLAFYRTNDGKHPFLDLIFTIASEIEQGDVNIKSSYIDVLKQIVYQKTEQVIPILYSFLKDEKSVREKAKKILLEISKYNIHVLNNIGYGPQRVVLDSLSKLLEAKDEFQQNLAVEILEDILEPSFEGTSNPSLNTLTIHHGPLSVTPYLEKIRRDAIDSLLAVVEQDENLTRRVKALKGLSRAFHMPDWPFGSKEAEDNFRSMLDKESKYLVGKYKKLVLDQKDQPIDMYPLVYEIERQMALLKVWKRNIPEAERLLNILRATKNDYSFYRLFAGDELDLRIEEGYDVVQKSKEQQIVKSVDSVTDKNIEAWYKRLQKVASFKGHTDDWRLNTFRDFLARIAVQKPNLANKLLSKTFKEKGSLYGFAGSLIFGLRRSSLALWDKYVAEVQKDKSTELTVQILQSFEMRDRNDINVRPEDIILISEIAEATNKFSFLPKDNLPLRYQIMRCLTYVSVAEPKTFRRLLLNQMISYPSKDQTFFDQIGTAVHFKWINLSEWSAEELKELADFLVKSPNLDYNHEQVLHQIGEIDFDLMMSVYDRRINREAKLPGGRYTAIPSHFSADISSFVASHPKYPKTLKAWISKVNDRRDLYAMDLGKFVYTIGGDALTKALEELITAGGDINLKRVLALFPLIETPDFEICFKIVAATDTQDIWCTVGGRMRSTGVLSGTYGDNLFGNALRSLKQRLEQELRATQNPRVKKFCEQEISNLEVDIERSDKDHEKELREDIEEFEADKDD